MARSLVDGRPLAASPETTEALADARQRGDAEIVRHLRDLEDAEVAQVIVADAIRWDDLRRAGKLPTA